MIQIIITYIILAFTFGYVIFKFVKSITSKNKLACSSSCASKSCEKCPFTTGKQIEVKGLKTNRSL